MADIKWIKLSTDLFDNRKIKQIRKFPEGDAILGVWMQILCLAGNVNNGGLVYFSKDVPYTEEMLATEFDRNINVIRLAMATFESFGMVELIDNILCVSNWEKYQSVLSLDDIKEKHRLSQKAYRERQKELIGDITCDTQMIVPSISSSSSNSNSISNSSNSKTGFKIPLVEEVSDYCKERNNKVNAERFCNHYESNGWLVGKNKMKNWKAAVRTWEQSNKKESGNPFKDALKKELEDDKQRSQDVNGGDKNSLSQLLSGH